MKNIAQYDKRKKLIVIKIPAKAGMTYRERE